MSIVSNRHIGHNKRNGGPLETIDTIDIMDALHSHWTQWTHCVHCFQCVHRIQRTLSGRRMVVHCAMVFNVSIAHNGHSMDVHCVHWTRPTRRTDSTNYSAMIVSRMIVLMNTIKWTQWTSIVSNVSMAMGHVHWIDTACLHCLLITNGHHRQFCVIYNGHGSPAHIPTEHFTSFCWKL